MNAKESKFIARKYVTFFITNVLIPTTYGFEPENTFNFEEYIKE